MNPKPKKFRIRRTGSGSIAASPQSNGDKADVEPVADRTAASSAKPRQDSPQATDSASNPPPSSPQRLSPDEESFLTPREEIEQIKRAIYRIDHGKYGVCSGCGKPIAQERLEAMPYASTCTHCSA